MNVCQSRLHVPFDNIVYGGNPHRRQIGFNQVFGYQRFQLDYLFERNDLLFCHQMPLNTIFFKIAPSGHILCARKNEHKECVKSAIRWQVVPVAFKLMCHFVVW